VKLVELLKRHEGKTLEYKRDLSSPDSILKCLVAFANTGGGIVVIGVEDGSKNVRGVNDVLAAEEKLANLVSDSIRPRLVPDIEVVPLRNLNVLAVQVYPSNTRPTTWNGWDLKTASSSAWVRPIERRTCRRSKN
jgi:ATP-dependent DNA helicase RecG